jgi:hypothetical protein
MRSVRERPDEVVPLASLIDPGFLSPGGRRRNARLGSQRHRSHRQRSWPDLSADRRRNPRRPPRHAARRGHTLAGFDRVWTYAAITALAAALVCGLLVPPPSQPLTRPPRFTATSRTLLTPSTSRPAGRRPRARPPAVIRLLSVAVDDEDTWRNPLRQAGSHAAGGAHG